MTKELARVVMAALLSGAWLSVPAQQAPQPSPVPAQVYLSPAAVPDHMRGALVALGNRLRKPGRERTAAVGLLVELTGTSQVRVLWELPGRLRIDEEGAKGRALIYDGVQSGASAGSLTERDLDVIESLLCDTAEFFLYSVRRGSATRLLGRRFRTEDGFRPDYQGPFYDIFELATSVRPRLNEPTKKVYYFDSLSGLLQSVHYVRDKQGAPVKVQTLLTDWAPVDGQLVPGRIVRLENDQPVLTFSVTSVGFSGAVNDGAFARPQ